MTTPCLFIRRLGADLSSLYGTVHGRALSRRAVMDLAGEIAAKHSIDVGDLLGRRAFAKFSRPRQELMWRLRGLGYGYTVIGDALGRDHNTIQKGCRRHAMRAGVVHVIRVDPAAHHAA